MQLLSALILALRFFHPLPIQKAVKIVCQKSIRMHIFKDLTMGKRMLLTFHYSVAVNFIILL